jgi:membrane associated rhomboid family serine protease
MSDIVGDMSAAPTPGQEQAERLTEQGFNLLMRQGLAAEAAGTFSQALQLAPDLVRAHLGMAEANLALGVYGVARTAANYVMRLSPGTVPAEIAQAISLIIDQKFQPALDLLEQVVRTDPGNAYAHALRGYVLRALHQDYDASLAEAKATRLASSRDIRTIFPPLVAQATPVAPTMSGMPSAPQPDGTINQGYQTASSPADEVRAQMRRNAVRIRYLTRGVPVMTYTIIGVCAIVFLIQLYTAGGNLNDVVDSSSFSLNGAQINYLVQQGQVWRLFTAMFLHVSIWHIFINMLSLYFIGPLIERTYGSVRYLIIYLISGLAGGATLLFLGPSNAAAVGASGAIAGIFGAIGAFFFINRSRFGPIATSILQQWFFWLALNVVLNLADSTLAWQDHLGGFVAGIILGIVLAPSLNF